MKTNQFRAMMLVLLMAVVSLGRVNAQAITVSGTVTDAADGTPIVACSVLVKGTPNGVVTNVNGQYSIRTTKGATLLFQYIGYKQEQRVVKSEKLNVKMKSDEAILEECVVVGNGTRQAQMAKKTAYLAICPTVMYDRSESINAEEYGQIQENGFKKVSETPLSTFSIDVDAASYSNMRRFINKGELPPTDAVRTEELVNYFS